MFKSQYLINSILLAGVSRHVATYALLCLNINNVVVPMQPCAAHSANNMDGHRTTEMNG